MVKAKGRLWTLLYVLLLLVSFFHWFWNNYSQLGQSFLITVLSIGTPAYLCYYLVLANPVRPHPFITVISVFAGTVISLHALLTVFGSGIGNDTQALTAFTNAMVLLAIFLLLSLALIATWKCFYPVLIKHPTFSVGALISGLILVVMLNIHQMVGHAILVVAEIRPLPLRFFEWYESLYLIFLLQLSLAALLLPSLLGAKWVLKARPMTLPLSAVVAMAINGAVGVLTSLMMYL